MPADRYPTTAEVREVGPRDGLQSEEPISITDRVRMIDRLSETGLATIEAGSFVHPDAVPSMAGTGEVLARITRRAGVRYRALVPNHRGAELAVDAGVDDLQVVVSVSDTHNTRNLKMTVDDSLRQIDDIVALAARAGTPVEAILGTAFGCPYEGWIDPEQVARLAVQLRDLGVSSLSFADTIGTATPPSITELIDVVAAEGWDPQAIALHLHNTRGTGLANLVVAAQRGVRRFDAAIGGIGGCPFAPGATGNVPTEDVVHLLDALGVQTGVDLAVLIDVALEVEQLLGHPLPGQVMRAGPTVQRRPDR